jgi:hypothetical protein
MIKNKDHAEKGLAKKGEFECTGCQCKYNSPFDTDQLIPIQVNHAFKGLIA